jgi:hypothetical protein
LLKLEEISSLRDLKKVFKECEMRLSEIRLEDLPSCELGVNKGVEQTIFENTIFIIDKYNVSIEQVSKDFNIPKEKLLEFLNKQNGVKVD